VKVRLDENIPHTVCRRLAPLGLDVDTVLDEGLGGRCEQWRIGDYVTAWLSSPDAATWSRCFVVATPTKVRITRPPSEPGDTE
jgi:hypothetical protein